MRKEFHITEVKDLPDGGAARLDFRWVIEKKKITDFAINVSLLDGKHTDIYRVDTKHGFLHEQKFWISPRPIPLDMDYNAAFIEKKKEVFKNHMGWIKLFKEARRRGDIR